MDYKEEEMWTCQRCTMENAWTAPECAVCYLDRHTVTARSDWWQCSHCTSFSPAALEACSLCERPRGPEKDENANASIGSAPQQERHRMEPSAIDSGAGSSSGCRESNAGAEEFERVWVCRRPFKSGVCRAHNGLEVYWCSQCGQVKPYLPHQLTIAQIPKDSSLKMQDHLTERETSRRWEEGEQLCRAAPLLSSAPLVAGLPEERTATGNDAAIAATLQGVSLHDHWPSSPSDEEKLEFPDRECRMVLVGKTGNGKSATANTIVGLQARFDASPQFTSLTKKCQHHNCVRFGIPIEVVDTPGLFDTEMDKVTVVREVSKCLGLISPGPHAILLVLRIGVRFTQEETQAVEEVHKLFGVQLLRFLVIVFTNGDSLQSCNERQREASLRDLLSDGPPKLKELLSQANHRYMIFDNTASAESKQKQVKQLLTTIKNLLKVNGGRPFTNDMMRQVENCMQSRERELEQEHEGRRRRKETASGRNSLFYREMAREEVVQETSLLQRIITVVTPILSIVLPMLIRLLIKKVTGGACSLM